MKMKESYELHIKGHKAIAKDPMGHYSLDQEKRYVEPFKIYGNLYYVGDSWVCSHIVDTGDGLILFDAGNCGATALLIQSIWEAGFNPRDIKWVILSHGHVDHIGATNFLKNMFGCKILLGEPDAIMFKENPELSYIQGSNDFTQHLFEPDILIKDKDIMTFGNTTVQFYLVPGHTLGCISCFFDVSEGDDTKRVGYFGGFGFNTMTKEYLNEIGDSSYKTREIYLKSLEKVRNEHVDIFMANHTNNNDLLNKRKYMIEHPDENPFVDDKLWGQYLDQKRDDMIVFMNNPKNI